MKFGTAAAAVVVLAVVAIVFVVEVDSTLGADGILYGLSENVGMVTINPDTGVINPLGVPLPDELDAQNLATLDVQRGIFYTIGYNDSSMINELLGVSVKDGTIVSRVHLPYITSGFVGVGEAVDVDPTNGEVFTVGLGADMNHHIYRVNPRSGSMKHLVNCGYINVLGGAHTYDMTNDLLWLQYGVNTSGVVNINLFAFNAQTGAVVHNLPESQAKFIDTLTYNRYGNNLVGFGFNPSTLNRTLLSLNGKTGDITFIGDVKGFQILNGGIVTINSREGLLYGQLQPPNNQTAPFYLIAVDVNTAEVKSSAPLCSGADPASCPWSMEFAPTPHF
eukprot:m.114654 g.114654  ORF g.114654 m.114654 type:complete len:334 (+) comp9281_c5_seq2:79-1080(+)